MNTRGTFLGLVAALGLSACAHVPSDSEKSALRNLQHEVKETENAVYSNKGTGGLFENLKYCSLQLHDRINPEEVFDWPERVDKHSDHDFFSDPNYEMKPEEYSLLMEKYKIYKQEALAKKENFEHRLKTCQSDLKSYIRREKVRSEQENGLVEALHNYQQKTESQVSSQPPVETVREPASVKEVADPTIDTSDDD